MEGGTEAADKVDEDDDEALEKLLGFINENEEVDCDGGRRDEKEDERDSRGKALAKPSF